ncbi:Adenine phosphoribosyltransferase [Carabus blaptoides fortunei]
MANFEAKIDLVRNAIASYPDFPKPGILFKDIFSVLKEPAAFKALHEVFVEHVKSLSPPVQAIAALESRGFLFGPMLALEFGIPFIPIRKRGKLPGKIESVSYELEYGKDTFEIQIDSLKKGTKVLIVDDLLATGGSIGAACELLKKAGLEISQCLVVMELQDLGGRSKITDPIHAFIQY